jgi:hypothetical protein
MPTNEDAGGDSNTSKQPPPPTDPPHIKGSEDGEGGGQKDNRYPIQKTKYKPAHWVGYTEALFGLILVFITAYYTKAAFRQAVASETAATAARSAADTAKDALIASSRPWVGIEGDIKITEQTISKPTPLANLEWKINARIFNYGPSPAIQVAPSFQIVTGYGIAGRWKESKGCTAAEDILNVSASLKSIFPKVELPQKEFEAAGEIEGTHWLIACIAYRGTFGPVRHSKFLYRANTKSESIHPLGNDNLVYFPVESLVLQDATAD